MAELISPVPTQPRTIISVLTYQDQEEYIEMTPPDNLARSRNVKHLEKITHIF